MKIKRIICASLAVLSLSTALLSSPVNAAPKMGDVNLDGVINVVDVSLTQQYLTGDKKIKFYPAYADFDRSGILDINDISLLQQYLSKSIIVYGDFIFQMRSNSKLISQSYFGNDTNVTVPGFLPGYNYVVTEIGSNTFSNNSKIATVTLPQNIGKLNDKAFNNCSKLTTVYAYNKNLKWSNSFYNCPKFKSIQFK